MKKVKLRQLLRPLLGPCTVGLALGSGGARGLAHIPVLEALDDLGVKPVAVAGSSIGAVVGAAYAGGMTGREIRKFTTDLLRDGPALVRRLAALQFGQMRGQFRDLFRLAGAPMQVDAVAVADEFLATVVPDKFGDLQIPLQVVATDYWAREEVVFNKGPLRPAVAASMAIPGLTRPVELAGRVLIDGGTTNPLPFDLLNGAADIVIAVDITPLAERREKAVPAPFESLFMALHIMSNAIVAEKLKARAPDILLQPKVHTFGALEFFRAMPILRAADPIKEELKRKLGALLEA
ncbi:MAG: patatin-like phospholipase family protein [Bradyrhizobiaceae bacterium]|nr:patatin-like phospholipase family protein [Bradyrhizobiaceae bacterium]